MLHPFLLSVSKYVTYCLRNRVLLCRACSEVFGFLNDVRTWTVFGLSVEEMFLDERKKSVVLQMRHSDYVLSVLMV